MVDHVTMYLAQGLCGSSGPQLLGLGQLDRPNSLPIGVLRYPEYLIPTLIEVTPK